MEGTGDPKIELLRLARRLPTIPQNAIELKEFAIRRMLVLGQKIRPLAKNFYELSPDGRYVLDNLTTATVLRETLTGRQIAIFAGNCNFVAEGRMILRNGSAGEAVELWDLAGRRVMTTPPLPDSHDTTISSNGLRILTISYKISQIPMEKEIICIQLWDGVSGKYLATIPIKGEFGDLEFHSAIFSPDSSIILTGFADLVNIWSAMDGRLLCELGQFKSPTSGFGIWRISFSPAGQNIGLLDRNGMLYQWRVTDWEKHVLPLSRNKNWDTIRWFGEDILGVECWSTSSKNGRVTFLNGHEFPEIERVQRGIVLTTDRQLFDLVSGQPVLVPIEKKYPPEISVFATDNQFLIDRAGVYDLRVTKPLVSISGSHSFYSRTQIRTRYWNWIGWNWIMENGQEESLPVGTLPSPEIMIAWANVVARGEIDRYGWFMPWDERKWEAQRQAVAKAVPPGDADIHLCPAIRDPYFWLRQEIDEFLGANKDSLPLIDRLIAAEPTWENFVARAKVRNSTKHHHLAIQDALDAIRLAGVFIDPFDNRSNDHFSPP